MRWFPVETAVNSGIHLGRLVKQKIPIRCQQPHSTTLPDPSYLSGRNGAEETPVTIHWPSNSCGVASPSGLVTTVEHIWAGLPAPPLPSGLAGFLWGAGHGFHTFPSRIQS